MNKSLAVTVGLVFLAVLVFRLLGSGFSSAETNVPVERAASAHPVAAAMEENPPQPMANAEPVQATSVSLPTPEPEPTAEQQFALQKSQSGRPPVGWGGAGRGYASEIDYDIYQSGHGSLRISSPTDNPRANGNAGQVADAGDYRGKRVQFSASIRTEKVSGQAALWFRADGADGEVVAFDNTMQRVRKLDGDRDWTRTRLVVDVPDRARVLSYGLILFGGGKAWMDDVRIEVLDERTPVTRGSPPAGSAFNRAPGPNLPPPPRNLGFEQ